MFILDKKIIFPAALLIVLDICHARDGFYLGMGIGANVLETKRTLYWDQDTLANIHFAEEKSTSLSGSGADFLIGWRGSSGLFLYGVEGNAGYAPQEDTFKGRNPDDADNFFITLVT